MFVTVTSSYSSSCPRHLHSLTIPKHAQATNKFKIPWAPLTVVSSQGVFGCMAETSNAIVCSSHEDLKEKEKKEALLSGIRIFFEEKERRQASFSPYDTAWVAMVPAINTVPKHPQFPQCLSWIMDHQESDGSWGVPNLMCVKDRLSHTLACVLALKKWNVGYQNIKKGLTYIKGTIGSLSSEGTYSPVGFEVIFPAMLGEARCLHLELPYESPVVKHLLDEQKMILKSKSIENMVEYDTSILFIVEGIKKIVDWEKVLKHQNQDGSILSSPSATACTLIETGNINCLQYLISMLQRVGKGVPSIYPIKLYAGISMIDRLERLGLERYFRKEIMEMLDDDRQWTHENVVGNENSPIPEIFNLSILFLLLRMHGYDVSGDTFGYFEKTLEQTDQAATSMLSLLRASQVRFPGETVLEKAEMVSMNYLARIKENIKLCRDNVILKDLLGEVDYALRFPFYSSLERIANKKYINQYGVDDIWLAKTSYRIPCISNDMFLTLAKLDYNYCQAMHQRELKELERWYADNKMHLLSFSRQKLVYCFFAAAATLFIPELSSARMAWTKNAVLTTIIDDFFDVWGSLDEIESFYNAVKGWSNTERMLPENVQILFSALCKTINDFAVQGYAFQDHDISEDLRHSWYNLVNSMMTEAQWTRHKYIPSMDEYMRNAKVSIALEQIVLPTLYFIGPKLPERLSLCSEHNKLMEMLNICGRLLNDIQGYKRESKEGKLNSVSLYMLENSEETVTKAFDHFGKIISENRGQLLEEVFGPSVIPLECKKVYWNMLKILQLFYHQSDGFSSPTEMLDYINSVIIDPIV